MSMNKQLLHKLRVEALFFTEQSVKANPAHDRNVGIQIHNNLAHTIHELSDDVNKLQFNVTVELNEEASSNSPYSFKITSFLVLEYGFDSEDEKSDAKKLASMNGVQMCISSIREHLATLTARGPWGPILMNPVVVEFGSQEQS